MTEANKTLTKSDLRKAYNKWYFSTELSNSYDRMQGLAFCDSLSVPLKKLYGDKTQAYKDALTRHMEFYNSEGTFGCVIHGITLSMEEENANGNAVPGSVITGIKTGLMGPIAGIGDTLIWGTLKPILYGIGCTLATQGNIIGGLMPFTFAIIGYLIGWSMLNTGYKLGKNAVMNFMKSGKLNNIIMGASILGLFMMGALSSNYVSVSTPLTFTMQNANPIVIQDILDSIVKGILPLSAIFVIYWAFTKKKANYNKIIFGIIIISMLCSLLGILG